MALNWSSVHPEHVTVACEKIVADGQPKRPPVRGIVVMFRGKALPAKLVLRTAFRLANGLEPGTPLKFSSGEGTVTRLQGLGFDVVRLSTQD